MRLHREGTPTILLILSVVCFGIFALDHWPIFPLWFSMIIGALLITVLLIVIWFFRIPTREVTMNDKAIMCPCDGKVVVIEEVMETEYFKDKRKQVSIFMSPLNVHINFDPISGLCTYTKYHPGKYLVAWHPKSSTENERSTVVTRHPRYGEILFRQIAGALARRICTYSQVGQPVVQGREFGFIKFGSRVDLFLPLNAKIVVELGQKVIGSTTVIGYFE